MAALTNNLESFAQYFPASQVKSAAIATAIIGTVTAVASAILCAANAGWIPLGATLSILAIMPPVLPIALCTIGLAAASISIFYLCVNQKSKIEPEHKAQPKSTTFKPTDLTKLCEAAKDGEVEAQYKLGLHFMKSGKDQGTKVGITWLELAAAQNHLESKRLVNQFYFDEAKQYIATSGALADEMEIARLLELAATKGHAEAQYEIALCYEVGKGVEQNESKMVHWLEAASAQGLTLAECKLGVHYVMSISSTEKKERGMGLLKMAAEKNHSESQLAYGAFLQEGYGGVVDIDAGFSWIEKSANQENVEALNWLGLCYLNAKGCENDPSKALKLFKQAAVKGSISARNNIKTHFPKEEI